MNNSVLIIILALLLAACSKNPMGSKGGIDPGHRPFLKEDLLQAFEITKTMALNNFLHIEWAKAEGATKYEVHYGENSFTNKFDCDSATICNVPSLTPGITYKIKVRALNANGFIDSAEYTFFIPIGACQVQDAIDNGVDIANSDSNISGQKIGTDPSTCFLDPTACNEGYEITTDFKSCIPKLCQDLIPSEITSLGFNVTNGNLSGTFPACTLTCASDFNINASLKSCDEVNCDLTNSVGKGITSIDKVVSVSGLVHNNTCTITACDSLYDNQLTACTPKACNTLTSGELTSLGINAASGTLSGIIPNCSLGCASNYQLNGGLNSCLPVSCTLANSVGYGVTSVDQATGVTGYLMNNSCAISGCNSYFTNVGSRCEAKSCSSLSSSEITTLGFNTTNGNLSGSAPACSLTCDTEYELDNTTKACNPIACTMANAVGNGVTSLIHATAVSGTINNNSCVVSSCDTYYNNAGDSCEAKTCAALTSSESTALGFNTSNGTLSGTYPSCSLSCDSESELASGNKSCQGITCTTANAQGNGVTSILNALTVSGKINDDSCVINSCDTYYVNSTTSCTTRTCASLTVQEIIDLGFTLNGGSLIGNAPTCTLTCPSPKELSVDGKACLSVTSFTESFSLNSASFSLSSNAQADGTVIKLSQAKTIREKTYTGTATSNDLPLDDYLSMDNNLSVGTDSIGLTSTTPATYTSLVFDGLNNQQSWTSFGFKTTLPFGKELATSAESGYASSVTDFSNMSGLWHFNESAYTGAVAEVRDSKNSNHGKSVGSVSAVAGKFNGGVKINDNNAYIEIPDADSLDATANLSIAFWMKADTMDGQPRGLLAKRVSFTNGNSYGIFLFGGNRLTVDLDTNNNRFSSSTVFITNQWYHVVVTFDGSLVAAQRAKIYINGVLDTTATEASASIPNSASNLFIGSLNASYGLAFLGVIDEVGIWKRTFTLSEVTQLYRRGANRVKFQLRTCSEQTGGECSGSISDWTGHDGTTSTFFSELNNKAATSDANPTGSTFAPAWSTLGSGFTTWISQGTNAKNQYAQFKAIFESDTSSWFPSLTQAAFTPSQRYSASEDAYSKISAAKLYHRIDGLSVTDTCGDANANGIGDDIRYEFSSGTGYLTWNGTTWVSSSGFTSALTKASVQSLTSSQWNSFPNDGNFGVRVYLSSDGTSQCQVSDISVSGTRLSP